jgi:opacity protein-like surface antigen
MREPLIINTMKNVLIISFLLSSFFVHAQNKDAELEALLGEEDKELPVVKTFFSSRIVNAHTTVCLEKKTLDFRINHRFGELTDPYAFFGLDGATMRLSFDYGITDNLMVGIGRSTYNKTIDGFLKYRILHQTQKNTVPLSLAVASGVSVNGLRWADPNRTNYFSSRLSYNHQVIAAKKFGEKFSLQLMPTLTHRNLIDSSKFNNTTWSAGIGIRQKLSSAVTLNLEYFYIGPGQLAEGVRNPLSLGVDIHTGWHTFQLHFTNATSTFEQALLTETSTRWIYRDAGTGQLRSQIRFGFNISREFHLGEY